MSDFAAIAAAIATVPAPTLAANLEACAALVRRFHESEEMMPKRAEIRRRLDRVRALSVGLKAELDDPFVAHFLGLSAEPVAFEMADRLAELESRASAASEAIPPGAGKGKAVLADGAVTAREAAALVILVAWGIVRGSEPGPDNADAIDAAASLWRAATGRHASGWRHHLIAAKELMDARDGRRGLVADIRTLLRRVPV